MKGHLKDYLNIYWIQSREKNQLFELRVLLWTRTSKCQGPILRDFRPCCIAFLVSGKVKLWLASIHDFFFLSNSSILKLRLIWKGPVLRAFLLRYIAFLIYAWKVKLWLASSHDFSLLNSSILKTLIQLKKKAPYYGLSSYVTLNFLYSWKVKLWLESIHDFFVESWYSQTSIHLKKGPILLAFLLRYIAFLISLKGQIMIDQHSCFFLVEFEYFQTSIHLKRPHTYGLSSYLTLYFLYSRKVKLWLASIHDFFFLSNSSI